MNSELTIVSSEKCDSMQESHQFRTMLLISIIAHIVIIGTGIITYTFHSQAVPVLLPSEVQIVGLYDTSEIPDIPTQKPSPIDQESREEQIIAFQNISAIAYQATPTPIVTPTPNPEVIPTPTPKSTSTPDLQPTPTPMPRKIPVQSEESVASLEIPRREAVISYWSPQKDSPSVSQGDKQQDKPEQQPVSEMDDTISGWRSGTSPDRPSTRTPPITLETENEFPYPEYLEHIKEKIEGLWFPEGAGTVSIYLVIERNGKILKSGVDKGTGVGVNKLRESIIRAIALIQRFNPLPEEYTGAVLRVRIVVRR